MLEKSALLISAVSSSDRGASVGFEANLGHTGAIVMQQIPYRDDKIRQLESEFEIVNSFIRLTGSVFQSIAFFSIFF